MKRSRPYPAENRPRPTTHFQNAPGALKSGALKKVVAQLTRPIGLLGETNVPVHNCPNPFQGVPPFGPSRDPGERRTRDPGRDDLRGC